MFLVVYGAVPRQYDWRCKCEWYRERSLNEPGDAPASSRFRAGGETAVEASRKHGPFDTRWPCAGKESLDGAAKAPLLRAAEAVKALDWDAFSNR